MFFPYLQKLDSALFDDSLDLYQCTKLQQETLLKNWRDLYKNLIHDVNVKNKKIESVISSSTFNIYRYSKKNNSSNLILFITPGLSDLSINPAYEKLANYFEQNNSNLFFLHFDESGKMNKNIFKPNDLLQELAILIDNLSKNQNSKITLCGISSGGLIALSLAQNLNEQIDKVILIATEQNSDNNQRNNHDFFSSLFSESLNDFIKSINHRKKISQKQIIQKFRINYYMSIDKMRMSVNLLTDIYNSLSSKTLDNYYRNNTSNKISKSNKLCQKVLVVIPLKDKYFRYSSYVNLIRLLNYCDVITLDDDETGLFIANLAKKTVWEPIINWLKTKNME